MTRFRPIEFCTRRAARTAGRKMTRADHRGACNHAACPSCGPIRAWCALENTRRKLLCIFGHRPLELIFQWPVARVNRESELDIRKFRNVCEDFRLALKGGVFGDIAALICATEYGWIRGGQIRPHIQALLITNPKFERELIDKFSRWWTARGGDAILFEEERIADTHSNYRKRRTLAAGLKYLSKGPLESFNRSVPYKDRLLIHDRLINPAERVMRLPASLYITHGFLLTPEGEEALWYRELIADLKRKPKRDIRRLFDIMYFSDVESYLNVRSPRACPKCLATGKDVRRDGFSHTTGRPRIYCYRCKRSYVVQNRALVREAELRVKTLRRQAYKLHKAGTSYANISKLLKIGKDTARTFVKECEAARSSPIDAHLHRIDNQQITYPTSYNSKPVDQKRVRRPKQ